MDFMSTNYIVNRLQDSQKVVTLMFQGKGTVQRSSEQDSLHSSVHEKVNEPFREALAN